MRAYTRASRGEDTKRLIVEMPLHDFELIDSWGIPAGMPSRAAAVRELLKLGLEAAAGGEFGDMAPAAGNENAALERGAI